MTRSTFLLLLSSCMVNAQEDLRPLYEANDWLELRRRMTAKSPALYRAATAAGMHQVQEAERLLRALIRGGDKDAHEHLINLYMRAGRFSDALKATRAARMALPERPDFKEAEAVFLPLAEHPDLRVVHLRKSEIAQTPGHDYVGCPISINGHPANYFWDTGANFSFMSESEAVRLGMKTVSSAATIGNSAGTRVGFQVAVAKSLVIGSCEIANVPFLTIPDDQAPVNEIKQEERGALGLHVPLALGGFRWKSRSAIELGFAKLAGEPNLSFDGSNPIIEIGFDNARLRAMLDTGAVNTDVWPPFARRYPAIIAGRKPSKHSVQGIGDTSYLDSISVDRLAFVVGGKSVTLAPADIYLEKTSGLSERYVANVGLDLLRQAESVTLDFRSMRLVLQ